MTGPDTADPLLETLRVAQRLGFFGAAPMQEAIAHAEAYVTAIGDVAPGVRIADIGSGGGLPGLVVARSLPHADVVLIDRREKRTDFLERAVRRLDLTNVMVRCVDAARVAEEASASHDAAFDVVTARGFGPPATTLRLASRLMRGAGVIVISEPPTGDRWDPELVAALGLGSARVGPVRRFERLATF
jgi:16S rRNA (guanine527-N7)-methyltransferase